MNFQAGLIVYWITTNVWTIGQQLLVKKLYPKPEPVDREVTTRGGKPARGKPPRRRRRGRGDAGGEGGERRPAQRPRARQRRAGQGAAASPRKKKKRSGRRR